eukprot:c7652_g1_i1.p1 GENE.c7652_g1_i1~~c7652_g1_i1.p1  ORF type:complete len:478 (-),score=112.40 c7652_g1_i1:69-1502(-)
METDAATLDETPPHRPISFRHSILVQVFPKDRLRAELIAGSLVLISVFSFCGFLVMEWSGNKRIMDVFGILFCVFGGLSMLSLGLVLRKNVNVLLTKQLVAEPNVVLVVALLLLNLVIDIIESQTIFSPVLSVSLIAATVGSILVSAFETVSRPFSLFVSSVLVFCMSVNTISYFISSWNNPCLEHIQKHSWGHHITYKELKRMLFIELVILLTSSVFVGLRDRKRSLINFPIGVVVKKPLSKQFRNNSRSLSRWLVTGNHLAELIAVSFMFVAVVLAVTVSSLWAVITGVIALCICGLFVIKSNIDKQVAVLVLKQVPVLVILGCVFLLFVLDCVNQSTAKVLIGEVLFFLFVLLNISLDAVRVVSRFFRVCTCIVVILVCFEYLLYTITKLEPCGDDIMFKHTTKTVTITQLKRLLAFTIVCTHFRSCCLLLFKSNKYTLYFVTTNVRKQFVKEHPDSDGVVLQIGQRLDQQMLI